ncbi:hypothetical protein TorRG33x02_251180, partial [Trema orientale]
GESKKAQNRYVKEAKTGLFTNIHHLSERPTRRFARECDDITFTEGDVRLVHHPHNDALMIKAKVRNSNLYRILVDNGSAADILYLDAYKKMGLNEDLLRPVVTPLYGFTGDFLIPRSAISLPITVGDEPRISTVITEFLVVDWPFAFNAVIGRPTLKNLKEVTSIYHLTIKFLTPEGTGLVRGSQYEAHDCYNKAIKIASKSKGLNQVLVADPKLASHEAIDDNLDP